MAGVPQKNLQLQRPVEPTIASTPPNEIVVCIYRGLMRFVTLSPQKRVLVKKT